MSLPAAPAAQTPRTQSLRAGIELGLSRIVRTWVALVTVLLGVLAVSVSVHDANSRLTQERELVVTRLRADLQATTRQLASLATSSVLWTGLTDSFGREAYLRPLLTRINEGGGSPFLLLDYRGRRFVVPEDPVTLKAIDSEPVRQAVSAGGARYGLVRIEGASGVRIDKLVLVQPVLSPQTTSPVGFIVATFDPRAAIAELPITPGLRVDLWALEDTAEPAASEPWALASRTEIDAGAPPLQLKLQVRLSRSALAPLVRGLAITLLIGLLGALLQRRIQRWAREFASRTTSRLDELVTYCREILEGRPVTMRPHPRDDEIADVFRALDDMLRRQQHVTEELRTSAKIFETSGEAILLTDAHGRIADCNPALAAMTGFSRTELIGLHAGVLYKDAETSVVSQQIRDALNLRDVWRGETLFRHRDGHLIPTYVAMSRLGGASDDSAASGVVAVISDITPLKAAQEQLHALAYRDSLTGLPNFRALTEALNARVGSPQARARPFLLMFFDMDHLKAVNDTHGHDIGDAVIKGLAAHLQAQLPPGHLLCRRSGDEFIALVERDDHLPLEALHARLDHGLNGFEVRTDIGTIAVSVSAGVARYPEDAESIQDLLIRADGALNQVKHDGRGAVGWYDAKLAQKPASPAASG